MGGSLALGYPGVVGVVSRDSEFVPFILIDHLLVHPIHLFNAVGLDWAKIPGLKDSDDIHMGSVVPSSS